MALPADAPDYLKNMPPPDDRERWRRMRVRFDQLAETVRHARLQTHREAAGTQEAPGKWRRTGPGYDVGFLPYVGSFDQAELRSRIEQAAELADALEALFAAGVATVELTHQWGLFCELAGPIELVALAETSDMHDDRIALSRGVPAQRKWVALQLLALMQEGATRTEAEAEVVLRVKKILAGPELDRRFPHEWYGKIVTDHWALRRAFTGARDLPKGQLTNVARTPFDVPPLPSRD